MSKSKKISPSELKSFTRTFLQCSDHLHTLCRLEVNQRLANYDVKYSQWLILDCLTQEDVDNPSKVAARLGIERATVSRCLDLLEARNLVSRTHNLADRRVVEIAVTAQGKKIAQMGVQKLEQTVQGIISELSTTQVTEVIDTLSNIKEKINHKIGVR
ncbi:MAG: MarR family transcriptional regulator [Pseudomonadota bacterium]